MTPADDSDSGPMPTTETAAAEADGTEALAEADPQEQALDALVDYLTSAGIETGGVEALQTLEAALEADAAEASPARPAAKVRPSGRRRARGNDAQPPSGLEAADLERDELEIRISADRLSATIAEIDEHTTLRRVAQALQHSQVRHGIAVEAVKAMVARARGGEVLTDVTVARGEPMQPGVDGCFEWEVDTGGRAGTILTDGSIDLRDRRLITVVQEGQLLGRLRPPREGIPGRDVQGRVIAPRPVSDLRIVPGANVRTEEEGEGVIACYAEVEGGVTHEESEQKGQRRLRLAMSKVSRIEQDVDYATGHVEFDGEVVITGSVRALFRVHATGSVTIEGNVESGARVEAGGELLVGGGVVGEDTELIAGGKVMAKFLQGCSVRTAGDVEVGAYVFEASIRCGGRLTVAGMGEGSGRALVGGMVWAAKGVETPSLGSPSNPRVRLILGVDPDAVDKTEALRVRLRKAEARRHDLLEGLGLERFDAGQVKALLRATTEPEARAAKVRAVQEFTRLGEALKHGRQQLTGLVEAQQAPARSADLVVQGPVFPGAEVRLGEQILRIREEARSRRYRLVEEDGELTIQAEDA